MIQLAFRVIWQSYPGLATCCLFWMVVAFGDYLMIRKKKAYAKIPVMVCSLGALSNAIATLGNGGFMPVLNSTHGSFVSVSVWVKATPAHRFLPLVDRYAGFSVGDFIILSGLSWMLAAWLSGKFWPSSVQQPTVVG